jgi:serine protease Do
MPLSIPGRVAEMLRRSTVQVRTGGGGQQGCGSGLVLPDHQVVTNAHVVQGSQVRVESWEGAEAVAAVVKIDQRRDLAVLSVPGLRAPAASFGDSNELKPGAPVIAVGNPLGFTGAVSSGVVRAVGATPRLGSHEWIQAEIRLAPGNSGGPLADFAGRAVGINTMIMGGLALAIPSRRVQRFLTQAHSPLALGVVVRPVTFGRSQLGILILELVAAGAAEQASLLPGDILVAGNGNRFESGEDLESAIDNSADTLLRLEFYRGGQTALRQVTVRLLPQGLASAA